MTPKKNTIFIVSCDYKVMTKKQATQLKRELNLTFNLLVTEWKLSSKNWGKLKPSKKIEDWGKKFEGLMRKGKT